MLAEQAFCSSLLARSQNAALLVQVREKGPRNQPRKHGIALFLFLPKQRSEETWQLCSIFFAERKMNGVGGIAKNMRFRSITAAMAEEEEEEEEDGGAGDHLASLPSVWKASGLEPSFMNFMADGPEMLWRSACYSYYLTLFSPRSGVGVGVDDSVSAASARRVPPLAYISRLLLLLPRALVSLVAVWREQARRASRS